MRYLSVLAMAFLAAAWVFVAPQSSTPAGDAAELKRWADSGFSPADAKPWSNVGIDPAEARQWVQAGIQFAEWAHQWKGEGFGPADARVWAEHQINVYTAGEFRSAGFSVAEAMAWMKRGLGSPLRVKEFRDLGFSLVEAEEWWRLEFFPKDAAAWKKDGFSAREALAWGYGEKEYLYFGRDSRGSSHSVYSLEWARQWRTAGFSVAEARQAGSFNVGLAEAAKWRTAGFSFGEAMPWRDSGFAPADAAKEKAAGLSPVAAEERRDAGSARPADVITAWHSDIVLRPDATSEVTETIVVANSPAGPAKRCFSRPFPATVAFRQTESFFGGWPSDDFTSVLENGVPLGRLVGRNGRARGRMAPGGAGVNPSGAAMKRKKGEEPGGRRG